MKSCFRNSCRAESGLFVTPRGKKSNEYAGDTNKPNAYTIITYLNERAIYRGFENVTNKPDSGVFGKVLEKGPLFTFC